LRGPGVLTYAKIKKIVADPANKITSLNDFLSFLKSSPLYHEYLRSFTLIFDSRSEEQEAVTPSFPRVVFHKDRLVLAVTGMPGTAAYNTLVMIEFDLAAQDFQFHRIEFPPELTDGDQARAVQVLPKPEDRPEGCSDCHGEKLRPRWATYAIWPGAYGGFDDLLFGDKEKAMFAGFVQQGLPTKRYQYFDFAGGRYFIETTDAAGAKTYRLNPVANFHLSEHLSWLNFKRILQELKRSEGFFAKYRPALAAALLDCDNFPEFLPDAWQERRLQVYDETKATGLVRQRERVEDFLTRGGADWTVAQFSGGSHDRDDLRAISRLRVVLELGGLSMDDWSLAGEPGVVAYDFSNGAHGITSLLYRELMHEVPIPAFQSLDYDEAVLIPAATLQAACQQLALAK